MGGQASRWTDKETGREGYGAVLYETALRVPSYCNDGIVSGSESARPRPTRRTWVPVRLEPRRPSHWVTAIARPTTTTMINLWNDEVW